MKYSNLAVVVTALLAGFGHVDDGALTILQEDCAGCGSLTAGVREWGLAAQRRDVSHMKFNQLWSCCSFGFLHMDFISYNLQLFKVNRFDKTSHVWAIPRPRHAQFESEVKYDAALNLLCGLGFMASLHAVPLRKLVSIEFRKLLDSEFTIFSKQINICL